jgi:hypothetical protein
LFGRFISLGARCGLSWALSFRLPVFVTGPQPLANPQLNHLAQNQGGIKKA